MIHLLVIAISLQTKELLRKHYGMKTKPNIHLHTHPHFYSNLYANNFYRDMGVAKGGLGGYVEQDL